MRIVRLTITAALALFALASAAQAGIFGPEPFAVSIGSGGTGANAPSGGAAISGDNRVARYVAFHSFATNLVPGDTNNAQDIFVYTRATGKVSRASVSARGKQANGGSANPAFDGSVQRAPRCVAFQSQA